MPTLPPARVVRAATAARNALQTLTRRMVPPQVALLELASGFMSTQAVYAVAKLGIADLLADGPLSADDIAAQAGCDRDATYRLLRACGDLGIFGQSADGRFALTALGSELRSGTRDSIRPVVLMLGDQRYQQVWGQLATTVQTGTPGAAAVFGESLWDYLDRDPQFAATVNQAMTRLSALDWPTVAAVYDFAEFTRIVDIGGGHGQLLALMLAGAPAAKGVLLERHALVGGAEELLRDAGVLSRCRIDAGSFFETAPSDGDLYVLRRVVHDFDDERALAILTTVRRAMPERATLLLMESVIPRGNTPHFAKSLDLDMMLFVGGRERTEEQFATLLGLAGFSINHVIPTVSTIALIEAAPGRRP